MNFNMFTKMFPTSQLVTLNPPHPDGVLVEPFKIDRISDVDPRVAVHVRLVDQVGVDFHDKYGNTRSYSMPSGSTLVAPLVLQSEKPVLKEVRSAVVVPPPAAPAAPAAVANPLLSPSQKDVDKAKTLLLDIARISKDIRNKVDVLKNKEKLRIASADFKKFPVDVRTRATTEAKALARRNQPIINEMNATLGGVRTRKNPVRFVRDHVPNVSAKDLRKLRTLTRRHNLIIPSQTTATTWKTFDSENPPKKVVRVIVDDGAHTFDFGLK